MKKKKLLRELIKSNDLILKELKAMNASEKLKFNNCNERETIIATNKTLKDIVEQEIEKYGNECDLNHIDVSNVTLMWGTFFGSRFNGDISKWDVSNVTNMIWMFSYSAFNGDISNWDVSRVTDMFGMFSYSPLEKLYGFTPSIKDGKLVIKY